MTRIINKVWKREASLYINSNDKIDEKPGSAVGDETSLQNIAWQI
jgi:hypothetical protein